MFGVIVIVGATLSGRREQQVKLGYIIAIIAIAAVLIFFILSYAVPGIPAWLVFIVAALAMMIAAGVKNKNGGSNG